MPIQTLIKQSEYHDSVSLMLVARELAHLEGILDASVVMGTDANKGLLKEAGLLTPAAEKATSNDLVIAVSANTEQQAFQALEQVDKLLLKKSASAEIGGYQPKTLAGAVKANPAINLAVISVAGRYAAEEAWQALHKGLHVLLFSDNVSLEDEIALKRYAMEHGLLLMGPGAGTAIINGVGLGFANFVPPGPVGIVSAAGTGLQEVSCLLARLGIGITQGIGTGGRDLKEVVGGLMMLASLRALQEDLDTRVILLVSKPPDPGVMQEVLKQISTGSKPVVTCFLGSEAGAPKQAPPAFPTRTLQEAAWQTALLAGAQVAPLAKMLAEQDQKLAVLAGTLASRLTPGQRYLRGLYSGGTLCYEAQVIWQDILAEPVYSNAPLNSANRLKDSNHSQGHSAVDLGEEEFTVGRPHPMIDNDLRIRRLHQEAQDPSTGVILLDLVLGYGAHPDPAAELAPAVLKAHQSAQQQGRELIVITAITGTNRDPQGLSRQSQMMEQAGAILCESNAAAAYLAARLVEARRAL